MIEGGPNQYIGESSRTVHVRRQQHLADYRYCAKKHQTGRRQEDDPRTSFMWDHQLEAHGGDHSINPEADFAFNVVNSHKDPLTRQIAEAVKIQRALDSRTFQSSGNKILKIKPLNRRSEHFAPQERKLKVTH